MSGKPPTNPGRRTFAPVVLGGLVAAGLTALAGARTWAVPDVPEADTGAVPLMGFTAEDTTGQMPAVGALALVVLACWGVTLVTRGRFRRGVMIFGWVVSLITFVGVVLGRSATVEAVAVQLDQNGLNDVAVVYTQWFWLAGVASFVALGAATLGVRLVSEWPEMGRKYDAPTGPSAKTTPTDEQTNLDLWKSMDEGDDPTR